MLRSLPLDVVKLDGEFVRGIDTDPATRQTVKSILEILDVLGLRSVAEGVETAEELEVVRDLGCDMAQGFYIALPAADSTAWDLSHVVSPLRSDLAAYAVTSLLRQ